MISFILTEQSLTVLGKAGAEDISMHHDHANWAEALEALNNDDEELLMSLMRPKTVLDQMNKMQEGRFFIDGHKLYFDSEEVPAGYTVDKIMKFIKAGLPYRPLFRFFERLANNPSFRVRKSLMEFLDIGGLPITTDGHFLAYKYTKEDGFDEHSGTVDYQVGTYVEMPRNKVDDDPANDCSHGLHVANRSYFGSHEKRFIACRIDPADVVSIPTSYDHSKMRVCRLYVEEQLGCAPDRDNIWDREVVDQYDNPYDDAFDKTGDFTEEELQADSVVYEKEYPTYKKNWEV